jgi:hypothetical protein
METIDNALSIYFLRAHFATAKNAMLLCNNSIPLLKSSGTQMGPSDYQHRGLSNPYRAKKSRPIKNGLESREETPKKGCRNERSLRRVSEI